MLDIHRGESIVLEAVSQLMADGHSLPISSRRMPPTVIGVTGEAECPSPLSISEINPVMPAAAAAAAAAPAQAPSRADEEIELESHPATPR